MIDMNTYEAQERELERQMDLHRRNAVDIRRFLFDKTIAPEQVALESMRLLERIENRSKQAVIGRLK